MDYIHKRIAFRRIWTNDYLIIFFTMGLSMGPKFVSNLVQIPLAQKIITNSDVNRCDGGFL
jgi:hypothetical protein